jgi:hypothetical protein
MQSKENRRVRLSCVFLSLFCHQLSSKTACGLAAVGATVGGMTMTKPASIQVGRGAEGRLQAVLRVSDQTAMLLHYGAQAMGATVEDVLRWALARFDGNLVRMLLQDGQLLEDWRFDSQEKAESAAALWAVLNDAPIQPVERCGKRWRVVC